MICEICGRGIEEGFLARIEGVEMNVCQGCSKYGKTIHTISSSKKKKHESHLEGGAPGTGALPYKEETEEIVVKDIGQILRKEREKRKLEQEEFAKIIAFKSSMLQKIESGDFAPSIEEAKRIGKKLGIKLTDVEERGFFVKEKSANKALTLGDFIKIKKAT